MSRMAEFWQETREQREYDESECAWHQFELERQQMQEECFQVLHQQKEPEHEME